MRRNACLTALLSLSMAALLAAPLSAQPLPDPLQRENHYKCYEVIESTPFPSILVTTRDQFGFSDTTVLRPLLLCNPVSKNGEAVPEREVHQVCYDIVDAVDLGERKVETRNQFGVLTLKVHKPRLLCVPSFKREL